MSSYETSQKRMKEKIIKNENSLPKILFEGDVFSMGAIFFPNTIEKDQFLLASIIHANYRPFHYYCLFSIHFSTCTTQIM